MRYFKLEDIEHRNMIIRADGSIQYMYEDGKWVESGIMLHYFCDESDYYDMYSEITEREAMVFING